MYISGGRKFQRKERKCANVLRLENIQVTIRRPVKLEHMGEGGESEGWKELDHGELEKQMMGRT